MQDNHDNSSEPLLESGLHPFHSTPPTHKRRRLVLTWNVAQLILIPIAVYGFLNIVLDARHISNASFSDTNREGLGLNWRDGLAELSWKYTRFDGSLYPAEPKAYRGSPSEEIDAEWDRFTTSLWMSETAVVLNVSELEIRRSMNDVNLDTTVMLDAENGGGYMGTIELFHQLHCLNVLRKWTYMEHYQDTDPFWTVSSSHRRMHAGMWALFELRFSNGIPKRQLFAYMIANYYLLIDHCIDILRQALMCNGDTGLVLFHWVRGMSVPTPDFHTMHKCRDPEEILQWANNQRAPIMHPIQRTETAKELGDFP